MNYYQPLILRELLAGFEALLRPQPAAPRFFHQAQRDPLALSSHLGAWPRFEAVVRQSRCGLHPSGIQSVAMPAPNPTAMRANRAESFRKSGAMPSPDDDV